MDPVSLAFYATVCACLSAASARLTGLRTRLLIGALVGIAAAALLPLIRSGLGV